jgi:colanic acid/amylovoran biosynthesis glycosyltransferase
MPVVGSLHCDIPEVVVNGKSGILVPERDVEALSQALTSLQESPSQVESFGTAARRHVEQHYSARSQGHRLADLYDQARSSFSTDSR